MKARRTLLSIALLGAAVGLAALVEPAQQPAQTSGQSEGSYSVDSVHSTVIFKIKHLGVSYFYGRFNSPSGSFTFDRDNPEACEFEIILKAENVDTGNGKRDGHLKSADFFNAKEFPEITFKSNRVRRASGKLEVIGDLTMHGVTKRISLDLEHVGTAKNPRGGELCGFHTTFTVKRSDFEIDFMPQGLGDEVTLMIGIEGRRR